MGQWKIKSNYIGTEAMYQCYRLRDENQPMHSGNIEEDNELYNNRADAEKRLDELQGR